MKRVPALPATSALALLILLLVLVTAGCAGEEGTTLEYDLQEGDAYTYDIAVDLDGSVTGPGVPTDKQELPEDTRVSMRLTMEVDDVTDGIATVTYRYDSLTMSSGGEENPEPPDMPMEFTIKLNERGEIVEIEGLRGIMPPGMSSSDFPFDPSQFAGHTTIVYPEDGPVMPGDTWSATTTYPLPGIGEEVTANAEATLTGVGVEVGRTLAEIDFTVDIPLDLAIDLVDILEEMGLSEFMPPEAGGEEFVFTMSLTGSQNLSGSTTVDVGSGMPTSLDTDLVIQMVTEVTEAPEMLVPAAQRGAFTMELNAHMTMSEVE